MLILTSLLSDIANLFTLAEIEGIRDRKDKFKSKLFAKKVRRVPTLTQVHVSSKPVCFDPNAQGYNCRNGALHTLNKSTFPSLYNALFVHCPASTIYLSGGVSV